MKNITLAVEDEVLAEVRKYAAANDTTVNGLVREYLGKLARHHGRAAEARKQLIALAEQSNCDPGENWKWDREALYDRGVFSRHERPALRGLEEPGTPFKKDDSD
ncbi:hypothetical protein KKP04_10845 [Rhodomicrobium sp. Az07]|uniref:hypothetical protein n=1 Tax=Rhodomicrobium sp. Az07 TaxID=2839034 RepID=UPI001BE681A3|nr:hypothetical protein [Rhodomicrobium sp. Az07]MBT3071359.1 hypothetical protein [Rhodomicrobium sp. Az07]